MHGDDTVVCRTSKMIAVLFVTLVAPVIAPRNACGARQSRPSLIRRKRGGLRR
ncbi:hypothetical protein BDZ85DRAFT_260784 [Elsinoe ampelina]|uniref:Uncharacterized protein n=1 Tax=Elsinoe ampelina TaxID=302913 RepID=A0A6A6GFD0_9PEZI|nr:hypothetical protein BDZ85DRAFT_260784 [Elsinoe ampelina]